MTFTIRIRGATNAPMVAEYECPEHGRFEEVVPRDDQGNPPDWIECPHDDPDYAEHVEYPCRYRAEWRISAPHGSVKQFEVVRGGVAKPDSPMYLDTRELGNGMPYSEWRAKRDKVYEERRWKESKAL